jgi:hypothetical protein
MKRTRKAYRPPIKSRQNTHHLLHLLPLSVTINFTKKLKNNRKEKEIRGKKRRVTDVTDVIDDFKKF